MQSRYHTNLTRKKSENNIEKRIFETRIRVEDQLKRSEIVATSLTSRDNTGPAVVAGVVPILPHGDFFVSDFFPLFSRMSSSG